MKKTAIFIVIFILLFSSISFANDVEMVNIEIDNKGIKVRSVSMNILDQPLEPEVPAILVEDRTLVPIRFIVENLGSEVSWNQDLKMATIRNHDKEIKLFIDSKSALVNEEVVMLDESSIPKLITFTDLKDARTMVPIRFISEVLGYDVSWDNEAYKVLIDKPKDELNSKINTISGIETTRSGNVVVVLSDEELDFSEMYLPQSGKYVIDFKDARLRTKDTIDAPANVYVDNSNIKKIEYSQFSYDPLTTRIAISLDRKEMPKVTTIDNGKTTLIIFNSISMPNRSYRRDLSNISTRDILDNNNLDDDILFKDVEFEEKKDEEEIDEVENIEDIGEEIVEEEIEEVIIDYSKKTIMIDAGHGGEDPGATYGSLFEKDINLKISLKLKERLINEGYNVLTTRDTDKAIYIYDRPAIANKLNPDIFISMHANAAENKDVKGLEVLYCPGNVCENKGVDQYPLAKAIHENIEKYVQRYSRGIKKRPDLIVLNRTTMPSVLIEIGFMSNEEEKALIIRDDYQEKIINGIVDGLYDYFKIVG